MGRGDAARKSLIDVRANLCELTELTISLMDVNVSQFYANINMNVLQRCFNSPAVF